MFNVQRHKTKGNAQAFKGWWIRIFLLGFLVGLSSVAGAANFEFSNLTDRAGGPGSGNSPWINDQGDVAFYTNNSIYFYDSNVDTFLNLMSLPGAPSQGWFPRLSNGGDIAFIDPGTRHVWFCAAGTREFTDLATLPGFPGVSGEHSLYWAFDMNNNREFALHAGPLNQGNVYAFTLADSSFTRLTGLVGTPYYGKECKINDQGVVGYNGYPDVYLYDPATGLTSNITDLPGGPGTGIPNFMLNNNGDIAIFQGDDLVIYNAANQSFWYLATLPGFPASSATAERNCLAANGGISFWADDIYYFDPADSSFTRLTSQTIVPYSGHDSRINPAGQIVFEAGADVWLADPLPVSSTPEGTPSLGLTGNYPNPFNPATMIAFVVPPGGAQVRLTIFDLAGRSIRSLVHGYLAEGSHQQFWDGRDETGAEVSSGTYFSLLEMGHGKSVGKMQLVR